MRNRDYMMIDGHNSMEYGIWLFGNDEYNFPQRDVEMISIPGRSGDLTIDKDRFKNIKISYSCVMLDKNGRNLEAFRSFLLSGSGYRKIETSFDPDYYRMGIFTGETKPKLSRQKDVSTFEITFNCKPQRFYKNNEHTVYGQFATIHNPTMYVAKPLLMVYGNGDITIGDQTIRVSDNDYVIYVDCELQNCYYENTNLNDHVELVTGKFPEIGLGDTEIINNTVQSGTQMGLGIEPRFWTL